MPFKSSPLHLTEEVKQELLVISRSTKAEHRMVHRSKIILLLNEGKTYKEIISELSTNHEAIAKWKHSFQSAGINGLFDLPGRGKLSVYNKYDESRVINLACSKPEDGYSSWSQQRIAKKLGMSQSTVCRILLKSDLKPHKT